MLLLVIVVILAALVAAFAAGLSRQRRKPSVDLAVYTAGSVKGEDFRLIFEHRGGDCSGSKTSRSTPGSTCRTAILSCIAWRG